MASVARKKGEMADRLAASSVLSRATLVAIGVGLVSFLATEFMHYLLVPDIGRYSERMLAEGVSAAIVALLTARLIHALNQRREAALLRMQVISEVNHHIRNALTAISLTAESTENQQCIAVISESVDRIEWTLREILLLRKPMEEQALDRLRYRRPESEIRRGSGGSTVVLDKTTQGVGRANSSSANSFRDQR